MIDTDAVITTPDAIAALARDPAATDFQRDGSSAWASLAGSLNSNLMNGGSTELVSSLIAAGSELRNDSFGWSRWCSLIGQLRTSAGQGQFSSRLWRFGVEIAKTDPQKSEELLSNVVLSLGFRPFPNDVASIEKLLGRHSLTVLDIHSLVSTEENFFAEFESALKHAKLVEFELIVRLTRYYKIHPSKFSRLFERLCVLIKSRYPLIYSWALEKQVLTAGKADERKPNFFDIGRFFGPTSSSRIIAPSGATQHVAT